MTTLADERGSITGFVAVIATALVMVAGAVAGGYGGARFGRWIGKDRARVAVVVIGLAVAAALLIQRARG